jgi:ParB-like chromosome segregation protein Spo0J
MKLETLQLNKLYPAKYNPRTITKDEFEGLKTSLETFGQQENLIVNKDMTIISGHQRYNAMKALGWTEAVCNLVDLDKHQEKKLNVLMNSKAISGKYDDLKLSEILEELKLDEDYEELRLNIIEPLDLSELDYSILDTDTELDEEMKAMADNVKKAIQIEFKAEDYDIAYEIVKSARAKNMYIGEVMIEAIKRKLNEN